MSKAEAKAAADKAAAAAATSLWVLLNFFFLHSLINIYFNNIDFFLLSSNKRFQQTQAQVDEVVDIMRMNVDKVLERDSKLSQLDDRAGIYLNL